jgi:hypothetical protein
MAQELALPYGSKLWYGGFSGFSPLSLTQTKCCLPTPSIGGRFISLSLSLCLSPSLPWSLTLSLSLSHPHSHSHSLKLTHPPPLALLPQPQHTATHSNTWQHTCLQAQQAFSGRTGQKSLAGECIHTMDIARALNQLNRPKIKEMHSNGFCKSAQHHALSTTPSSQK